MNRNSENTGSWSWLMKLVIFVPFIILLIWILIPNSISNGRTEVHDIINVLRLIDSAKYGWALEHSMTNEVQISQFSKPLTETDLLPLLARRDSYSYVNRGFNRDGTLHPIAGEIYTIGRLTVPPEAKLTTKLRFGNVMLPEGTIIRLATDPATGFPHQIILPNQKN